ncbi:MAG: hypothetical protein HQL80_07030 [Magnetococcales bacterium]|nr:hypothetical protein [Magnetococcales bacterium]MBF0583973.1 hypothetical protein [Magnetococcales bacterium]
MKPETIVATMAANGIYLYVSDAGELRHRGKRGQMTGELRAILTEHKEAIREWLQADPGSRLLTDEEKHHILEAFNSLRDQHGHALVAAGWDRDAVFSGTDPLAVATAGDVHGVIWLLMRGAEVAQIAERAIFFRLVDDSRVAWLRGGCLVSDPYLAELERTTLAGR